jgi:hypothetical protein
MYDLLIRFLGISIVIAGTQAAVDRRLDAWYHKGFLTEYNTESFSVLTTLITDVAGMLVMESGVAPNSIDPLFLISLPIVVYTIKHLIDYSGTIKITSIQEDEDED